MLNIPIEWRKPAGKLDIWYDTSQTAELWYQDRIVGTAGKGAAQLGRLIEGDTFIFELDAPFLLNTRPDQRTFEPLAKFPGTNLDISLLVPIESTVDGLIDCIANADARIRGVEFVGSFEKLEWVGKKSVTLRFEALDPEGTLDKHEIDQIWDHVAQAVRSIGAEIR
jgi:phenylalanyl-tRNA synthetase beta chain